MQDVKMKAFALIAFLLAASSLSSTNAHATNIIANPGFETGALAPWFQDRNFCGAPCVDWSVTSADAHSGSFSATDVGNLELRQNFSATPTSTITEVSFWMKHPDGGGVPAAFDLFYSDNTDQEFIVFSSSSDWEFFNVTSDLQSGKSLVGFSFFGVSGTGTDQTFLDDVTINANLAVPEPQSMLLLASGLLGFIAVGRGRKTRRTAA